MANGQVTAAGGIRRDRINIFKKYELRDWAICLDTPASLIEEAVRTVGDRVDTVVAYLQQRAASA